MQHKNETDYQEPDLRPKALRYEEHGRTSEKMIMDALPEVVDKLVSMAKEGNVPAARYLLDRIHGRPARLAAAPVVDTTLRYSHSDLATDEMRHKQRHDAAWRSWQTVVDNPFAVQVPGEPGLRPGDPAMIAIGKQIERRIAASHQKVR